MTDNFVNLLHISYAWLYKTECWGTKFHAFSFNSHRNCKIFMTNFNFIFDTICVPYIFRKSIFGWNCDHDTPLCDTPLLEDTPLCDTPDELYVTNNVKKTCWEATHELLHLHQHRSTHGDHLVDDGGGGTGWCRDLLPAGLLRCRRLDSWIAHLHISASKRNTPVRSLLSLTQACRGKLHPGQHLDGETMYSRSLLMDGCHSAVHIPAIQQALVSPGRAADRRPLRPWHRGAKISV